MKKIIYFVLLLPLLCGAQKKFSCHTESEPLGSLATFAEPVTPDPSTPFVINVFFHIITDNSGNIDIGDGNGSVPNTFGEEEVMEAMEIMSQAYAPYNIFFKYRGFDVVADSNLTNNVTNNWSDYNVNGCFNLYYVNSLGGAAGEGMIGNTRSSYSYWGIVNYAKLVIVHELGHNLTLLHTFQLNTGGEYCEHVTRDGNDADYNADIAGDQIEDTPATPSPGVSSFNYQNCTFVNPGNMVDCIGELYENIVPNYLSYDTPPGCTHILTPGQARRARTFLNNITAPHLLACFTTVQQLFQPYDQRKRAGEVVSTEETGDGTMIVCRKVYWTYYFQQGYYWQFYNNGYVNVNTTPGDWPIIQIPYGVTSLLVRIAEVQQHHPYEQVTVLDSADLPLECTEEEILSGNVVAYRYIGGPVLSENALTQNQLRDPYFYNSLNRGYYYVITKTTGAGTVSHKTVYVQ